MAKREPLAKLLRDAKKKEYNKEVMIARIKELAKQRNESFREASLRSGLDNSAIHRLNHGQRPSVTTLIYLANHFEINPNELLELALWPRLHVFDISNTVPDKLPTEAVEVAVQLSRIKNPGTRKKVAEAIMTLLEKYFE